MSEIGHNSGEVSAERLKSFIKRIEKLNEDKNSIGEDIKEVFAELKGTGFCPKTVRKIVSMRKIDIEKRREEEELLELYKTAIGLE